jgi:hypothetical protein
MGHNINGFIGLAAQLATAARALPHAHVCKLKHGFALLPLTNDIAPDDDPTTEYEHLVALTQPMVEWAKEHSSKLPLAYIETEYFGGTGVQAAIMWDGGSVQFGPTQTSGAVPLSNGAINIALRRLGVPRGNSLDEFDALGLGIHRDNDDWLAAAGEPVA